MSENVENVNQNVVENVNQNVSENQKNKEVVVGYVGTFLGADWIQGKKKDGTPFNFGKVKIDFDGVKRDGGVFTSTCEFLVDDPRDLPRNDIERYTKVYAEFKLPSTPQGKLQFSRIVGNV